MNQDTLPTVSIIVPVYNEEGNILVLCKKVLSLRGRIRLHELIFVDDCSTDRTAAELESVAADPAVKVIRLMRNYGQTAALAAGFDTASGDIIVTMDGDNQNDPQDIPAIVAKLQEGYDMVSGWRKGRWKESFITRKIPSLIANRLISGIGGIPINDFGCAIKAYRADSIKAIRMYGDMHRYMPLYVFWNGGRIAEVEVSYFPRLAGTSKYGLSRIFKVLVDLFALKYYGIYFNHPMYFFGKVGAILTALSFPVGGYILYQRYFNNMDPLHLIPLTLLVMLLIIGALQFILMGILAELNMRIYYESQNKRPYAIKCRLNF